MDLYNAMALAEKETLAAAASRNADLTGTAVDILNYEGVALFVLNSSAATAGTTPTLDVKIQHCDTSGGTYADVTGGAFTQVTTAASLQTLKLNVANLKRYLKLIGDIGGTDTPAFTYGAEFIGFKKAVNS